MAHIRPGSFRNDEVVAAIFCVLDDTHHGRICEARLRSFAQRTGIGNVKFIDTATGSLMSISLWGMSTFDVGFYGSEVQSKKEAAIDITCGGIVKHHGSVSELPTIVQRM